MFSDHVARAGVGRLAEKMDPGTLWVPAVSKRPAPWAAEDAADGLGPAAGWLQRPRA